MSSVTHDCAWCSDENCEECLQIRECLADIENEDI